jgi:quercetin dioxygenase-like cupin family protein
MEARMDIREVPFSFTDWMKVSAQEHKGETGTSFWRTFEKGNIRVRLIDYSESFKSDHWCSRGHVLYVLQGELTIKLKNDKVYVMPEGTSFQVGNDENNPHLALTSTGARVLIVD